MSNIVYLKSFAELVESIRASGVPFDSDPARQVIELSVDPELPGRQYIRWETKFPLVQLIQPVLKGIPIERLSAIESAVCRLNSLAIFPGLGVDYTLGLVYFRITTPIMQDGVRVDVLQTFVQAAVGNGKQLLPVLQQIIAGANPDDIQKLLGKDPSN